MSADRPEHESIEPTDIDRPEGATFRLPFDAAPLLPLADLCRSRTHLPPSAWSPMVTPPPE